MTASVPYSVLELALSLTFQHRSQDAIGWFNMWAVETNRSPELISVYGHSGSGKVGVE